MPDLMLQTSSRLPELGHVLFQCFDFEISYVHKETEHEPTSLLSQANFSPYTPRAAESYTAATTAR
jgi:hypothetical protein